MLDRAIQIAVQAHSGQKEKKGRPYLLHPIRLMLKMQSKLEMMAATLHDVVEDTEWTPEDPRGEGFPEAVLEAMDCLTHRKQIRISSIERSPLWSGMQPFRAKSTRGEG